MTGTPNRAFARFFFTCKHDVIRATCIRLIGKFFNGFFVSMLSVHPQSSKQERVFRSDPSSVFVSGWPSSVAHVQGVQRGCFSDVASDALASPAISMRQPHSHAHIAWAGGE